MDERFHGGKGGMTRNDDLIARPHALELVQQTNNERPGRAEDALFGAGVGGQFGFEGLTFLAQNVLAGAKPHTIPLTSH